MRRQIVILGGGTSVLEGIKRNLFDKLTDKFVVGLNYAHHFLETTLSMYVDGTFVSDQKEYLERLPLVIGMKNSGTPNFPNFIELPASTEYFRDCSNGIYKASLVGLFALSFLIYVLDEGDIFLLGYDYGAQKGDGAFGRAYDSRGNALTHWYQHGEIKSIYTGKPYQIYHRGFGKINWYEATQIDEKKQKRITRAEHEFSVYENEKKVSIYNVSLDSRINTFPKIGYDQFFSMLSDQALNQDSIRSEVREKTVLLSKKLGAGNV